MKHFPAVSGLIAVFFSSIALLSPGCNEGTRSGVPPASELHEAALPIGNPHPASCPVMGGTVDLAKASADPKLHSDYQGMRYLFCCAGCKPDFDEDPAKFIANPAHPKGEEGNAAPASEGHDHEGHVH